MIQNHFFSGRQLIPSHSESLLALQPNIYFMGVGQGLRCSYCMLNLGHWTWSAHYDETTASLPFWQFWRLSILGSGHLWCPKPVLGYHVPQHIFSWGLASSFTLLAEARIWNPIEFGHRPISLFPHLRKTFTVWWSPSCYPTCVSVTVL